MNTAKKLRLGPLPSSSSVKLTFVCPSSLKTNLDRYATLHAQAYGEAVDATVLIPHMLEAFMSMAAPVLLSGMCQRASSRCTSCHLAMYSSPPRTPVPNRIRMASALGRRISAFNNRCSSSRVSIKRLRIGGLGPNRAESMIPTQGFTLISRLPQACV